MTARPSPAPVDLPFADLALAQRLEFTEGNGNAAFIDARRGTTHPAAPCRIAVDGTLAMFDGPGSPLTQTFGLGIAEPATPAALDELERFFKSRGSDVFHEVSPLAGVDVAGHARQTWLSPDRVVERVVSTDRGLGGTRRQPGDPGARGQEGEADLYTGLAARGWSESPEVQLFIDSFARISLECASCFVAEAGGTPIAAGAVFLHEGVALLAGASTVPEGRRQGAQLALLDARLRFAASKGCDLAMMCAAPGSASQRNAERNGFRIAYTRTKWQL